MKLSPNAKKVLGDFVLDELEETIEHTKKEITNLRIKGLHHKAEKKQKTLRFYWELWSELEEKIDNLEAKSNFTVDDEGIVFYKKR